MGIQWNTSCLPPPSQDSSDHWDYEPFLLGNPNRNLHLPLLLGGGVDPRNTLKRATFGAHRDLCYFVERFGSILGKSFGHWFGAIRLYRFLSTTKQELRCLLILAISLLRLRKKNTNYPGKRPQTVLKRNALYVWPLYVSTLCVTTLCEHSMCDHSMCEHSMRDHSMWALYVSTLCVTTLWEHPMCEHSMWAPHHHHKNTTIKTPPHHHKNTSTPTPPQKHHHTNTKTPPQKHHHTTTCKKTTPPQKHDHTTSKTPTQKHLYVWAACVSTMCGHSMCEHSMWARTPKSAKITTKNEHQFLGRRLQNSDKYENYHEKRTSVLGPDVAEHRKVRKVPRKLGFSSWAGCCTAKNVKKARVLL